VRGGKPGYFIEKGVSLLEVCQQVPGLDVATHFIGFRQGERLILG
jgi:hypothetical protein